MRNYYYFITSLPPIEMELTKLPIKKNVFIERFLEVISPNDLPDFTLLQNQIDNQNLINILDKKDEFSEFGNLSLKELQEGIKYTELLPTYMQEFLDSIKHEERKYPQYSLENELQLIYLLHIEKVSNNSFLKHLTSFSSNLKNVCCAIVAKQFEIERKSNILLLNNKCVNLIESNLNDFGLMHDFDWMEELLGLFEKKNLYEREVALLKLQTKFIDDNLLYNYFSFNKIIGYYTKLSYLDRFLKFNADKGKEIFEKETDKLATDNSIFKELN